MPAARGRTIGIAIAVVVGVVAAIWFLRGGDHPGDVAGTGSAHLAPPPPLSPQRARIAALLHPELGAIDGTVGEGGRPVAGAVACARATDDDLDDARCATTDPAGAFALSDLPPASYHVWASAAGLATVHAIAPVAVAPGQRAAVALVLARGGAVVGGLVRDVRGHPIAGATVQLGADREDIAATATTAADGTFSATVGPPGDVSIYATARGFVDADASTIAPAGGIVLAMTPEAMLAGTVVAAATHEPVPDATVSAGGEQATTDASGHFEIAKLAPGRYKPTATAVGGYGEAAESVRLTLGGSATGLVIELHPVAAVIGQIVIGSPGATPRTCPPGAGEVFLSRYGSSQAYRTRTIADGTVILEGVVGGTYEVSVSCKGFLPELPYADLTIGDSDLPDQVWRVAEGARVVGTVVDAVARAPVAGAYVNHIDSGGLLAGTVKTDDAGAFAIDGVAPGIVTLSAGADGFARDDAKTHVTATLAGAPVSATLVLHRGGTLTGSVVDARGAPVAGADVRTDGNGGDGGSTRSDARGEFTLTALSPGDYGVYLQNDWSDLAAASRVTATVTLDRPARVRLVQPAASGTVSGVVVDERGAPVIDAYVDTAKVDPDATRPSYHDPAVLTGLDGSYAFSGLPPGTYSVRARRLGGGEVATPAPVPVGATGVRLVLGATGVLAGVVTTADGAPVDDATIGAADRTHDREREERMFHTGGKFALRELPPGTYQLRVNDDPRSAMTVTLGDGEQRTDLKLVAQVRYTVRGRLVDDGGRPLAGWKIEAPRLELEEATGTRSISVATIEGAITDGDGRFLVRNMPSGPLEITAADVVHDPDAKTRAVTSVTLAGANPLVDIGDVHPGAPTE